MPCAEREVKGLVLALSFALVAGQATMIVGLRRRLLCFHWNLHLFLRSAFRGSPGPEIYTVWLTFAMRWPCLARRGLRAGWLRLQWLSEHRRPLPSLGAHLQLGDQLVKILAPSNNLPSLVNGVNITCQEPGANFLSLWIKHSAVFVQI